MIADSSFSSGIALLFRQADEEVQQMTKSKKPAKWQVKATVGFLATANAAQVNALKEIEDDESGFMDGVGGEAQVEGEPEEEEEEEELHFTTIKDRLNAMDIDDDDHEDDDDDDDDDDEKPPPQDGEPAEEAEPELTFVPDSDEGKAALEEQCAAKAAQAKPAAPHCM